MILSTSIRSWFGHLIRWVKTIFSLKGGLIFLLVVLFSAFVAVMVSEKSLLDFSLSRLNQEKRNS